MTYASTPEKALAKELGFTIEENPHHSGTSFYKGNRHIWAIQNGWQTAQIIKGYYTNHKRYTDLMDALRREYSDD